MYLLHSKKYGEIIYTIAKNKLFNSMILQTLLYKYKQFVVSVVYLSII